MKGFTIVLRALHRGEGDLARALVTAAEHHRNEHEFHHVATDVARWSREHVRRLAAVAADCGLDLGDAPEAAGLLPARRREEPDVTGHHAEPGLLLLRDLRDLHLHAAENSLHWEMLAQAAQAAREQQLLALATACHPQTLRQMRWTNTMIKTLAPQTITSL
ncbi:hypothetical protein [Streptodolium elevatio]|uniref:Uncharacterized protein n=1 Tax=Streptodolium elevatio TaxID=3157996 RepID=A0ABV3DR23_9ACTN